METPYCNEDIPLTAEILLKCGADKSDNTYIIMLDEERHIDLINMEDGWFFNIIQEPCKGIDTNRIMGRKIHLLCDLQRLYFDFTGKKLTI